MASINGWAFLIVGAGVTTWSLFDGTLRVFAYVGGILALYGLYKIIFSRSVNVSKLSEEHDTSKQTFAQWLEKQQGAGQQHFSHHNNASLESQYAQYLNQTHQQLSSAAKRPSQSISQESHTVHTGYRVCPNCRAHIHTSYRFCPHCGWGV